MAVVGSVLSTRYQSVVQASLVGYHVPAAISSTILGSLGGALGVARFVGGPLGAGLAAVARNGFVQGNRAAMMTAAGVTAGGALLALAALPSLRTRRAVGLAERAPQEAPGTAL